jgi:CrcB protein
MEIAVVGIGGALGAILRFLISKSIVSIHGTGFPYGTLAVNVLGSFTIGVIFVLAEHLDLPRYMKPLIITGFLGALTTFSTFSIESVQLLRTSNYSGFLINIGANVVLTLTAVLVSMWGTLQLIKLKG